MTLEINHPEVDDLAQELARTTGETVPQAVVNALREQLAREKERRERPAGLAETLLRIGQECARLPLRDERPPEEIVGYDKHGIPA